MKMLMGPCAGSRCASRSITSVSGCAGEWESWDNGPRLPVGVLGAVESRRVGSALDVVHAGRSGGIGGIRLARNDLPGAVAHRERIVRYAPQVAGADKLVKRARILAPVRVVLIDRILHVEEVGLEHGFARARDAVLVLHEAETSQHHENRGNDQ